MADLYWRQPAWLLLIFLPLFVVAINRWWEQHSWQRIADAKLLPWLKAPTAHKQNNWRLLYLFMGWLLLCIALAGPRSISWLPPEQRPDPSMLVAVIDLSASMNARDIHPDRRSLAQRLLKQWLKQKPVGLKVGLIVYAGHAFTLLPATSDIHAISHFVETLANINLPTTGNELSAAIKLAAQQLISTGNHRRLLIITDGDMELEEQQKTKTTLQQLSISNKIQTQIIGIGENKAVTVPDFLNDRIKLQGRPVLSRLQAKWLQQLAVISSIQYQHSQQAQQKNLDQILQLPPERLDSESQKNVIWQDWYALALFPGILFIIASVVLQNRRSNHNMMQLIITLLVLFLPALINTPVYADNKAILKSAQQALEQKNYQQARDLFAQLDSFTASFGKGTACYRLKDYDCARIEFSAAAWEAQQEQQRAISIFNLANSYFFLGDYDQAAVLYRDAELAGIDADISALNLSYAISMQNALQRHVEDIKKSFARAQWRAAAAGEMPPALNDLLANQRNLLNTVIAGNPGQRVFQPSSQIIQQQINRLLGLSNSTQPTTARQWVKTDKVSPQSTAAMMNRLFEMELGIMAPLKQPQSVTGKRPW